MPLQKLTPNQLLGRPAGRPNQQYVQFLQNLRSGEGGRTTVSREGTSKQTIKNRLKVAASHAGVKVHFLRSPAEEVVFRVER